jgi:hypothetical protein
MKTKDLATGTVYACKVKYSKPMQVVLLDLDQLYTTTFAARTGRADRTTRLLEKARAGARPQVASSYMGAAIGYLVAAPLTHYYDDDGPVADVGQLLAVTADQAVTELACEGELRAAGIQVFVVQPRDLMGEWDTVAAAEQTAHDADLAAAQAAKAYAAAAKARAEAAVDALADLGIDACVDYARFGDGYVVTLTAAAIVKLAATRAA